MWCASLSWQDADGKEQTKFVVIVYDKDRPGGEKNKNGNTGRMCLRELVPLVLIVGATDEGCKVDPARGKEGCSLLHQIVPTATKLILSGDTGLLYARPMLNTFPFCKATGFVACLWPGLNPGCLFIACSACARYHGTLFKSYGLEVEQLPLPPRHAFNASDRLLARLNTFFRRLMRVCFLVGAKQFAECLAAATDPTMTSPQRLIKRCHVLYRNFTQADWIPTPALVDSIDDTTNTTPAHRNGQQPAQKKEKFGIMKVIHNCVLYEKREMKTA